MRVFLRVFLRVSFGRDEISAARARGDGDARSAPPGRAPRRRCLRTARCASSPRRQRPRSGARDLRRRDSGFETNDESAREREKMDVVAERARGGFETRGQRARRRETPRARLRGDQRARGDALDARSDDRHRVGDARAISRTHFKTSLFATAGGRKKRSAHSPFFAKTVTLRLESLGRTTAAARTAEPLGATRARAERTTGVAVMAAMVVADV